MGIVLNQQGLQTPLKRGLFWGCTLNPQKWSLHAKPCGRGLAWGLWVNSSGNQLAGGVMYKLWWKVGFNGVCTKTPIEGGCAQNPIERAFVQSLC